MYINAKHSKKLGANGDAGGDGVDGMLGGCLIYVGMAGRRTAL
jgi:hypothetical protein